LNKPESAKVETAYKCMKILSYTYNDFVKVYTNKIYYLLGILLHSHKSSLKLKYILSVREC